MYFLSIKWKSLGFRTVLVRIDFHSMDKNILQNILFSRRWWALFVTYTIIQSIMRSEMCSLHLTHPSGAVGSRHCGARGAVGGSVPCSRVSPQSWTLPARAGIRTYNLELPWVSSPTLYPLGHDCPLCRCKVIQENKTCFLFGWTISFNNKTANKSIF